MTKLPNHVAIIPDGNRRWAKEHHLPAIEGHRRGAKRFQELAQYARQKGIHTLTAWGFSTENWSRDQAEVGNLMDLFILLIKQNETDAHRDQIRIRHFGRKDRLPPKLLRELIRVEHETRKYDRFDFNICIDYGGQDEVLRAVNKVLTSRVLLSKNNAITLASNGGVGHKNDPFAGNIQDISFAPVTLDEIYSQLDTADQRYPNPDLLIRTSGEMRTSGLLPLQMVYAELYFEHAYLPDFTIEKLELALSSYSNRDRRFGGNSNK